MLFVLFPYYIFQLQLNLCTTATSWGQKKAAAVKRFKQESIGILSFKIQRRGRQQERQKTVGFISKTTTCTCTTLFCTFLCPFLHDYDVNMPNFAFYGGRKQATTKFYFSFCTWIWCLGIQLQEGSPTFDQVSG